MKILFAILLVIISTLPADARNNNVNIVYQSTYRYLSILDYETNDTATVVIIRCMLSPGKEFILKNSSLYLCDEQGRTYGLKRIEGLTQDNVVRCLYSGQKDFTLVFDPLAKNVEVFDLRASNEFYATFAFWGIHKGDGLKRRIKHVNDKNYRMTREEVAVVNGSAWIKGDVSNYSGLKQHDTLQVCVRGQDEEDGRYRLHYYQATVAEDGSFEMKVPLEHMCWVYIESKASTIPVILYPNDTIDLTIDGRDDIDRKVTYSSRKGNDMMPNLMKAAANYTSWDFVSKRYDAISPSTLQDELEQEKQAFETFSDYLAWKYKLTPKETHLLRIAYYSLLYEVCIASLSNAYNETFWREEDMEERIKYIDSEEVIEAHGFMRAIDTDDYSYLILPSQYLLLHLHRAIPVVSSMMTKDMYIEIIEKYIGRHLNEDWRKRVDI